MPLFIADGGHGGGGGPQDGGELQRFAAQLHQPEIEAFVVEQIAHHPRELKNLPVDDFPGPRLQGGVLGGLFAELQGVPDRGQWVAQFMAENGQELILALGGFPQLLLRLFAQGDVLGLGDEIGDGAIPVPDHRDGGFTPDDPARPMEETFFCAEPLDLARLHVGNHIGRGGLAILGMGEFDVSALEDFLPRITEHVGVGLVDLDVVAVGQGERDRDGRVVEHLPKPLFAGDEGRLGSFLRADVHKRRDAAFDFPVLVPDRVGVAENVEPFGLGKAQLHFHS